MKTIYRLQCPSFQIDVLASSLGEAAIYAENNHGRVSAARQLTGQELSDVLDANVYFKA